MSSAGVDSDKVIGGQFPLVSVAIPFCNAARTLAQSLDSVLALTYPNLEIIVVDDGSSDDSAEVLKSYGERIRAYFQPYRGIANARNAGCHAVSG